MDSTDATTHASRILAATNHFIVLGLPPKETTIEEIKKSFKRISLLVHPDKWKNEQANATFKKLREAFELLSDEQKQRQYLRLLGFKTFKPARKTEDSSSTSSTFWFTRATDEEKVQEFQRESERMSKEVNDKRKRDEEKKQEQENMQSEWKEEFVKKYTGDTEEDKSFQEAFERRTSSWQQFKKGRKMEARKPIKKPEPVIPTTHKSFHSTRVCGIYSFHEDDEES